MLILAVDTSAGPSSCTLIESEENGENAKLLSSNFLNVGLTHSETLMPMVDGVLNNAKRNLSDIDYFAVSRGPGSFTGVRIGVAAIKGMAFSLEDKKNCLGLSTLESMAYMWRSEAQSFCGIICPVMDARRSQVYTAIFECGEAGISQKLEDSAMGIDALYAKLKKDFAGRDIVLVGDGAGLCYKSFSENYNMKNVFMPSDIMRYQNAVGVGILACMHIETAVSAQQLMPAYLRLPQAEREMLAKKQV